MKKLLPIAVVLLCAGCITGKYLRVSFDPNDPNMLIEAVVAEYCSVLTKTKLAGLELQSGDKKLAVDKRVADPEKIKAITPYGFIEIE